MKLVNIGFGNIVSGDRLIAIVGPESAPIKRTVQEARANGVLIDATCGRRTRAVLITDSDLRDFVRCTAGNGSGPSCFVGRRKGDRLSLRKDRLWKKDC